MNKLKSSHIVFMTIASMMGSGIILLPTKLAQVGTLSVISWLVSGLGSLGIAYMYLSYNKYQSHQITSIGSFSRYVFGNIGVRIINFVYFIAVVFTPIAVVLAGVGYLLSALQEFNILTSYNSDTVSFISIVLIGIMTIIVMTTKMFTGRLSSITVWFTVIPIIGTIMIGMFYFDIDTYLNSWNPNNLGIFDALKDALSITIWSFLGLEFACANSSSLENAKKVVPLAVFSGVIVTASIYILSTNIIFGIIPNSELIYSNAPFGLLYSKLFNPTIGASIMLIMSIACLASTLNWQYTTYNMVRQFKVDNHKFSYKKFMVVVTILQLLMIGFTINGSVMEQFNTLSDIVVIFNLMPYITVSICVYTLSITEPGFNHRFIIGLLSIIVILYVIYSIYTIGITQVLYSLAILIIVSTFYSKLRK